jgi:hypothetical protein
MSRFIMETFLGLPSFSPMQNSQNTSKNYQTKKFSEKAQNADLLWEFFWDYDHFHPYKIAKTLVKILRQKNFQKMLKMLRFIMGIFWGLGSFSPIQNG